jgi:hypothetical protein
VPPAEVANWKASIKTKACYDKLFRPFDNNQNVIYMMRILEKVWPRATATNIQVAYAITVCQITLSSHYDKIILSEKIAKNRLNRNLVSIFKILIKYLK